MVSQTATTLPAPRMPTFGALPVRCNCCNVDITATEWRRLHWVGLMDDGDGGFLELRNHAPCMSTLGIELEDAR